MQIKKIDREFIEKLCNKSNVEKVCDIFDLQSRQYKEAKLIYFNLGINTKLSYFKNKLIHGYSIIGISNYEKSYILDNRYNSKDYNSFKISKTINLDLNILTYLKNLFNDKNIEDRQEFIEYLKYIKNFNYNVNMSTSLLERISKPININVWSDYILSFVKYETLDSITEDAFKCNTPLPESKYIWAKEILDLSNYKEEQMLQFYVIDCLLSKSFILKMEKSVLKKKFINLLDYSLNELNIYPEFELYLMYKYLNNELNIQRTFAKIQDVSKKSLDNIKNTSWDILHIRLVEIEMINNLKEEAINYHYIGTKDLGLQNIININPLKMIGILDDEAIIVREQNINEIFQENEIDEMLQKHQHKTKLCNVNYKEKFNDISKEIENLMDMYLK